MEAAGDNRPMRERSTDHQTPSARGQRLLAARVRLDWVRGLEARCRREHGRPLTDAELRAGLRRYPGDPLPK